MCSLRSGFRFFFARLKSLQDINFVNTFRFADCNGGRFQA
ncbi:hypothetical protein [Klebsiella pneumoniae ISC21]|nr:hypothetical protein [Klebsiella pneumoniae ISC21]